jgi:hypothetical protein
MKLVLGFRLLAATIDIAALVKSVGAAYQNVGMGQCLDSNVNYYDHALSYEGQTNNIDAAYNWCLSATNYKSKLVGVTIAGGIWLCLYDNGAIDNFQTTDFKPTALGFYTSNSGTGAVILATGDNRYTCYRNLVRRIDSNCVISSLIFSHGIHKFSCLIS